MSVRDYFALTRNCILYGIHSNFLPGVHLGVALAIPHLHQSPPSQSVLRKRCSHGAAGSYREKPHGKPYKSLQGFWHCSVKIIRNSISWSVIKLDKDERLPKDSLVSNALNPFEPLWDMCKQGATGSSRVCHSARTSAIEIQIHGSPKGKSCHSAQLRSFGSPPNPRITRYHQISPDITSCGNATAQEAHLHATIATYTSKLRDII